MKVKDLRELLNQADDDATVLVKVEVTRNWECYTVWAPIFDVDDYGDQVRLNGEDQ